MNQQLEFEIKVMPDRSIGMIERNDYGYMYDDILPLTKSLALKLFTANYIIYRLYPDNTEAMVFDPDEIVKHDGIFGIEAAEWLASREYAEMVKSLEYGTASHETTLIFGSENAFALYQLKQSDDTKDYRFEPFDRLVSRGLEVERKNYELIYYMPLNDSETPDSLFMRFNTDGSVYLSGHLISVSDVIVIQYGGKLTSHYIDNLGFKELPSFLGNEYRIEYRDSYDYIDLLREYISNHLEVGYLTELQAQVLYSKIDLLNKKMLAILSLYESGIPLDIEADTIGQLFHDALGQLLEQTEPTPGKQESNETQKYYSIMADLKEKISTIAKESRA